MSDQPTPAGSTDSRIDAALREYLERIDRGEPVDREEFISRHAEIADALRSFFAAEEPLRKMAGDKTSREIAGISTRSIAAQGQETVPPKANSDRAPARTGSGLAGQFGRYQIIRALGSGAMGAVYLALDTQLKRNVAIKTPHFEDDPTGELLKRFYREAESAATLLHANICPVYDVGEIDGKHFISMAYIEGRPLSDLIKGDKAQNERHMVIAVHKLARALQQAHDHGIVHRDLKPANIMVNKQGEPVIMDFGLARKRRAEGEASLTHSGMLLGSPAYMSPEQIEGDPDSVGPASDQYSLGVVLYELLTRQLPFRGSVVNVLAQILTKDLTRPSAQRPGLDPRIEAVCLRMMAKKASDRFPSMKAVADELAAIVKNPAAQPTADAKSPTASRSPAAPGPTPGAAGASQVQKSVRRKVLTESDVASLEELVRKCLRRHDYDQIIQIIERIPEDRRTAALKTLLEKAREKADEIAFLICEIDEADRFEDGQTALKKAELLLKVKAGHHRALEIQEKFSGYGEGGSARVGASWQLTQRWNEGGWIPWSVLAFGLAVFAAMLGVMVIYLRGTAVVIEINAPGIEVTVNESAITIKGPGKEEIKVEPGKQELKITYAGLETITKSFSLKKGETKTVTVSLADAKLIAKLGNEILVEQDVKSGPAGPGAKSPQGVAQSPPDEKKKDTPGTTAPGDPDRRAAEWVLSIGSTIKINENGQEREIKPGSDLPRGAFELTLPNLDRNAKVTDAGLACFEGCKNLTSLELALTQVTDAGLFYFKDCKKLTSLALGGTRASDAGLANFKDCKKLTSLSVWGTQVSDSGLAYFKDCKNLKELTLGGTQVSDAGLAYFKDRKNLTWLSLLGPQVTDAGLANFKDCKNLTYLRVSGAQVSDVGLAYFKECKNLTVLQLVGTQASDVGLAYFKECKNLTYLELGGTHVSDAGLANFKDYKNLTELLLGGSHASDAGLANFKDCKNLTLLWLNDTEVTDSELERLAGLRKLASLFVKKTHVSEAGVKKLAAARPGCKIEWDGGIIEPRAATGPDPQPAAEASFVPLFNGKDLTGWKTHPNNPGEWRVQNGILTGRGPVPSLLFSERDDYQNFHLRVEARINSQGDSGVCFRIPMIDYRQRKVKGNGYEAQIDSGPPKGDYPLTGSLMHFPGTGITQVLVHPGQWFTLDLLADDYHFVIKVNGKKTVDFVDSAKTYQRGHIAVQVLSPSTVVEFRKIEIKELPPASMTASSPALGLDGDLVYERRTYTVFPGKMADLDKRFHEHTFRLFEKHGLKVIAYSILSDKPDTLEYILAHKNREAAEKSWKDFVGDPEWNRVREESEKNGPLVKMVERHFLSTTSSPALALDSDLVYERRTYTVYPGKMADLNKRFHEHTFRLFEKHGLKVIAYSILSDKPDTLEYILAHKNREAAEKSWRDFAADPKWKRVVKETQKAGPLVKRVERHFLSPSDYRAAEALRGTATLLAETNQRGGQEFLAANKTKVGIKTRPSGLQYLILEEGKGKRPGVNDSVTVHYKATLLNGQVFDQGAARPAPPKSLSLKQVIPGWREALQLMKEGSTWRAFIPSDLAYGSRGTS